MTEPWYHVRHGHDGPASKCRDQTCIDDFAAEAKTMTTEQEPRTEATLEWWTRPGPYSVADLQRAYADGQAAALKDIAERVRGLPGEYCLTHEGSERTVNRAAVLALLSTEGSGNSVTTLEPDASETP